MKEYKQFYGKPHQFEVDIQGEERLKMFKHKEKYLVNYIAGDFYIELGVIRKDRNGDLEFVPLDFSVSSYSAKLVNAILEALEWAGDFLQEKQEPTREDHLNTLIKHQLWRTGSGDDPASPQDLAAAVECAIQVLKKQDSELTINTREDLIREYEHLTGGDAYTPSGKPKVAYSFWLEEKMLIVLEND